MDVNKALLRYTQRNVREDTFWESFNKSLVIKSYTGKQGHGDGDGHHLLRNTLCFINGSAEKVSLVK